MSVVVGVKERSRVVLAADSRVMFGELAVESASPKLRRTGPYVIGVVGDATVLDAVFHRFVKPTPPPGLTDEQAEAFMVRSFIPAYREMLREYHLLAQNDDEGVASAGSKNGSSLMVAWEGHLFGVSPGFALAHMAALHMADGSGYEYAYGALGALAGLGMDAESRARRAVEVAIQCAPGCGGPVCVVATEPPADDALPLSREE